jgi:hypothetical protein
LSTPQFKNLAADFLPAVTLSGGAQEISLSGFCFVENRQEMLKKRDGLRT